MPMDVGVSVSNDINKCHGLCNTYSLKSRNVGPEDLSVNNLGNNDVIEFQNIQNDSDVVPDSKKPYRNNDFQMNNEDIEMCLSACDMFPCSSKTKSANVECVKVDCGADDIRGNDSTVHDNIDMLPTPLKPVSAMKGSREKRGAVPPQKLTVKWDPDVYDPIPTSVSHAVTNNKPQKQSKKNSKSKQKNGSKSSHKHKYKDKLAGKRGGGG